MHFNYYLLAIQNAIRSLDFKYIITSFFRDLTSIYKQIIKYYIIVNAFKDSRM
jgi:hypothetical protein